MKALQVGVVQHMTSKTDISFHGTHIRSVECRISEACYWILNFLLLYGMSTATEKQDSYQTREVLYVISPN